MKTLLWITALLVVLSAGYNIGLRAGIASCKSQVAQYSRLYDQAIMWQIEQQANLPHITKNPRLLAKTPKES